MISEYFIQWLFDAAVRDPQSVTEVLHQAVAPSGAENTKTTHPTAHPRVYFWYLN